jgi:hypothetical protein
MKIVELINHIRVPITNEEADVLGKFHEEEIIEKSQLDRSYCSNRSNKFIYWCMGKARSRKVT